MLDQVPGEGRLCLINTDDTGDSVNSVNVSHAKCSLDIPVCSSL
jgi:hypothetical protein